MPGMDEGRDVRRLIEGAMTTIKATVKDRRLELDVPADWPDGIEVEIHPVSEGSDAGSMSPEEIAKTLAAMDRVEPFDLSDLEHVNLEHHRKAERDREKASFIDRAEQLRKMWE